MPDPSLLQTLLDRATAPLTTLPQQAGNAASEALNNRGWGKTGAMAEALGNTLGGMTSPASIAMMAFSPIAGRAISKALPAAKVLGEVPVKSAPILETLGERSLDHTPVGGEELFNVARGAAPPAPGSDDALYQLYLQRYMNK